MDETEAGMEILPTLVPLNDCPVAETLDGQCADGSREGEGRDGVFGRHGHDLGNAIFDDLVFPDYAEGVGVGKRLATRVFVKFDGPAFPGWLGEALGFAGRIAGKRFRRSGVEVVRCRRRIAVVEHGQELWC